MKAKAFAHKVISYGPGGYHCPCCGPAPSKRREERQQNRRVLDRVFDKIERQEQSVAHIDVGFLDEFDWDWYYHGIAGETPLHEEWLDYKSTQ